MRYRNLRTVVLSGLVMILFPSNAISVTTTVGEPCSTAHFSPVLLRRLSIRGGGLPAKKDSTTDYWNDWSLGPRTEKKKQERYSCQLFTHSRAYSLSAIHTWHIE